ncbi:hypothetical protein [Streptomyces sp. S.PNR 29]|uniref:hypothetical protein n=1 Tax=Streptomyces sp. S.PNR 29 TaxID=2973805 RepID=UPI0025B21075|nr:hypothetical protein [Streptomyces sp. S.PNR 29]MDN0201219.1 hypothetical protein [Streptomyces sp. S.PNR 29]
MSPNHTPEEYERWHKRTCVRCLRHGWFAARWPDGHVCRTCHDKALLVRGTCPGCGDERALPGLRPGDGTRICSDCADFMMSYQCSRCGTEDKLHRARLCEPFPQGVDGAQFLVGGGEDAHLLAARGLVGLGPADLDNQGLVGPLAAVLVLDLHGADLGVVEVEAGGLGGAGSHPPGDEQDGGVPLAARGGAVQGAHHEAQFVQVDAVRLQRARLHQGVACLLAGTVADDELAGLNLLVRQRLALDGAHRAQGFSSNANPSRVASGVGCRGACARNSNHRARKVNDASREAAYGRDPNSPPIRAGETPAPGDHRVERIGTHAWSEESSHRSRGSFHGNAHGQHICVCR